MCAVAGKILFWLILVAILAFILGYILGRSITCDKQKEKTKPNFVQDDEPKTTLGGVRPYKVDERSIVPDDLKQIRGIGEKIEKTLNELGIFTFEQIANWSNENVAWVDEYLSFKGRIQREEWIEQAKLLCRGEDTEFSTKYKDE